MIKALRIPAEGRADVVEVDVTLKWLQHQVGGLVEMIHLDRVQTDTGCQHVEADVYINEDGKGLMLPLNPRATDLCALVIGGWCRDIVVGGIVVLGCPDDDGEDTAVPDAVVSMAHDWGWL